LYRTLLAYILTALNHSQSEAVVVQY
jgi:hypothetical protein